MIADQAKKQNTHHGGTETRKKSKSNCLPRINADGRGSEEL